MQEVVSGEAAHGFAVNTQEAGVRRLMENCGKASSYLLNSECVRVRHIGRKARNITKFLQGYVSWRLSNKFIVGGERMANGAVRRWRARCTEATRMRIAGEIE